MDWIWKINIFLFNCGETRTENVLLQIL